VIGWFTDYVDSLRQALPDGVVALTLLALAIILVSHLWALVLFLAGSRPRTATGSAAPDLVWVFLVPALDEEVTIADSVRRLVRVQAQRRLIVVIDDGSTDATPQILAGLDEPDLVVVRRDPPAARQGKGAALNDAWSRLGDLLVERFPGVGRSEVVVAIVDADGRLDPAAPEWVGPDFADERVGGVQVNVRIYNRQRLLTWMQDVEFGVYGGLYQLGRSHWSTAGMGGNGQFNRLSALDAVADERGPWRDRLTEDQDLGLRLIRAGWVSRHEHRTFVEQQGLPGLRRLYRQRTRWAQGNLEALGLLGVVRTRGLRLGARLDLTYQLLLPILQLIVGVATVAAIACWLFLDVRFVPEDDAALTLTIVFLLAFGGVALGCVARARGRGVGAVLTGLATTVPYAFYSWLIWPVMVRALLRLVRGATGWDKTAREPLEAEARQEQG
jgi:cellulose synthase/poly-beta-1,6-N-acetylglucosamine synthase-like glycosyltransferase